MHYCLKGYTNLAAAMSKGLIPVIPGFRVMTSFSGITAALTARQKIMKLWSCLIAGTASVLVRVRGSAGEMMTYVRCNCRNHMRCNVGIFCRAHHQQGFTK